MTQLRPAKFQDLELVFAWRNTPHIVALSLSQSKVDMETHKSWFCESLGDPSRILYIIEDVNSKSAGLLRLDKNDASTVTVTIYLDKPFLGKGLGSFVLKQVPFIAVQNWPEVRMLRAEIRRDNKPSIHAFGKSGFTLVDETAQRDVIVMQRPL